MAKKLMAILLIVVLVASLGITVVAASGVSTESKLTQVTYFAKDGIKGPPPNNEEPPVNNSYYELLGISQADTTSYYVNPAGAPSGSISEVQEAFEVWDAVTAQELFTYGGTTTSNWLELDGQNTVSWVSFLPRTTVAVTSLWYDADGTIVEYDMAFNTLHRWGIDPDDEGRQKLKRAYDVENVATHEVGHVVGLADLYEDVYKELTMYGYTSKSETQKISLEEGDIAGAQYLYGTK